jgi:2-furoate---CoA ligase
MALASERYPGREAVVDAERRYRYAEWNERINRLAWGLLGLGVHPGDRLVMMLKNREETAAAHWAMQKIGAVATPINWRYGPVDVEYVMRDAAATAVLCEAVSREAVLAAQASFADLSLIFVGGSPPNGMLPLEDLITGGSPLEPNIEVRESDLSVMLYTSGTTGRPKGVPRTHRAEHAAATAHVIQSRIAMFDRTLGAMPFYHTMGVRSMLAMAILNGCLVIQTDWDPTVALALLEQERVNSLYLVPTLYHDLINAPGFFGRDLSRLRKLGYAGAPMSEALTRRLVEALAPQVFVNHLGSTEVYTFTICDRVREKPTCAGRAGINAGVRVVRADVTARVGPDDVVAPGETGELIVGVDSDEAFGGYWNRPDADARAIRQGWYFTGDLVYEDAEGDLYVLGRVDDMIISGGENIYPAEVEEVLLRHPGVDDVAVVGLPDERLGQQVTAFVVAKGDRPSPDDLDRHCRQARDLPDFRRPRRYRFVPSLPRSPTGKLLRRQLRDQDPDVGSVAQMGPRHE